MEAKELRIGNYYHITCNYPIKRYEIAKLVYGIGYLIPTLNWLFRGYYYPFNSFEIQSLIALTGEELEIKE